MYTHETGEVVFAEATGRRPHVWDLLRRLEAASNTQQRVTAQYGRHRLNGLLLALGSVLLSGATLGGT